MPLDLNTFARKWATGLPQHHGDVQAVYVRDELIFAYTHDGTSVVFNRDQGEIAHYETVAGGRDVLHAPLVLKEVIVYPTLTALQTYDRKGGQYNRTSKLPFAVRTNAVAAKNIIYLGADFTGGGRVIALDIAHDYVPARWQLMFPQASVSAAPALFNDSLFAASDDGSVAAVAADNREPLWQLPNSVFQTGGAIHGDLAVDETGLYVASSDSKLYCLNRTNGKVKWQYYAGTALNAGPVVTKDLIFQIVPGTGLVALDKTQGVNKKQPPAYNRQPRWIIDDGIQFLAGNEKYVFLERSDHSILAVDKIDGKVVFKSTRSDFVAFGVNTKDDIIYGATKDGQVMAIQAVNQPGLVGEMVRAVAPAGNAPVFADMR
jgi:outer membrane protein assembly factor BamB